MRTAAFISTCSSATTKPFPTSSTTTRSWTRPSRIASPTSRARPTRFFHSPSITCCSTGVLRPRTGSRACCGSSRRARGEAFASSAAQLSSKQQVLVLGEQVDRAQAVLLQKARSFILQVSDFLSVRILDKQEAFRVLKRTLNFDPQKARACQAQARHLSRLLPPGITPGMPSRPSPPGRLLRQGPDAQGASAQSFPLIFKRLLEVEANFYVVTEWKKEDPGKTRGTINSNRRHFHNTKRLVLQPDEPFGRPAQDKPPDRRLQGSAGPRSRRGTEGDGT